MGESNYKQVFTWADGIEYTTDEIDELCNLLNGRFDNLVSPDTDKKLRVTNTTLDYHDGTAWRIILSSVDTDFYSPNGASNLKLGNGFLDFNDAVTDRIEISAAQTKFRCPGASPTYMEIVAGSFEINDGVDRFMFNASKSIMAGPNDVWWSGCYNDKYEVMDYDIARIQASATDTRLIAPDGSILKFDNDGLEVVSDDLNPSFNIIGNGEVFRITQAQGTNGFFMTWYDHEDNRMSYFGHGQSANQQHLWLVNEMTGGNLIIDTPGIVDIQTILQTDGYRSADGTAGYTGTILSTDGFYVKNGLVTGTV